MGGTWAPRPSTGPHKLRECLPLVLILRNRLKYALTKGQNQGRVGVITGREKHVGSFEIVHVKDSKQRSFATRISNVFCIAAKEDESMVSLPRGKGLRDNILEERKKRLGY